MRAGCCIERDVALNSIAEPFGTLDVALAHATALLGKDPARAAQQAHEILKIVPGHPLARLVLGSAHRISGRAQDALAGLEPLARDQPRSAPVHLELVIAPGEVGRSHNAVADMRPAVELKSDSPRGWRLL